MDCSLDICEENCGHCPIDPWLKDEDFDKVCCDTELDPEIPEELAVLEAAVAAATEQLWALSGRQFGFCKQRFLPCARPCWVCKSDPCNCCALDFLRLPYGPPCQVTRYVIEGEDQDLDSIKLFYRAGEYVASNCDLWPTEQCQAAGYFEVGDPVTCETEYNWWIEYIYGRPIPAQGKLAALALACEYVYSCTDKTKCQLPTGVTSVSRQGLSYNIETSSLTVYQSGLTGIGAVDRFLSTVNPNGLMEAPSFTNPDSITCQPITYSLGC